MTGVKDRSEEIERTFKADAEAARIWAQQTAALAQEQQRAADAALGLTKESRALVAEFEGVRAKGESVADALAKITKNADLSDVRGIQTFATALDALAQRAQITGLQVREALAGALKGIDLGLFETQARAAFDGSEQGARRLKAALDAIADESLRRAGTSLDELRSGFNKATNSAINDVDAPARTLKELGITGEDASRALSAALDKATAAASTERALRAVEERVKALGEAGELSGEQVTEALSKIQRKADELRPGVNSLSEALRTFGLQTRAELQATADRMGEAYRQIAASTEVSVANQIAAFEKYRAAAIAANKGVEPTQVAIQRRILETRAAVAGLGDEFTAAMGRAEQATRSATNALQSYIDLLRSDPSRLVSGDGLGGIGSSPTGAAPSPPFQSGSSAAQGEDWVPGAGQSVGQVYYPVGAFDKPMPLQGRRTPPPAGMLPAFGGYVPIPTPAPKPASVRRVEIKLPSGNTRTVDTSSRESAEALLKIFEEDLRALGG